MAKSLEQRIIAASKTGTGVRLTSEEVAQMADWPEIIDGAMQDDMDEGIEPPGRSEWHHWNTESASTRGERR